MTTNLSLAETLLPELSRVLWKQRDQIQMLEYRLEVQQMFMVAGRAERLALAVGEVEAALASIREVEGKRLDVVGKTAQALGLPADATLTQIRTVAPDPWGYVLGDHHQSFLKLVASTEELSSRNRELAQRALGETHDSMHHMSGGGARSKTYGKHGDRTSLALPPTLIDREV